MADKHGENNNDNDKTVQTAALAPPNDANDTNLKTNEKEAKKNGVNGDNDNLNEQKEFEAGKAVDAIRKKMGDDTYGSFETACIANDMNDIKIMLDGYGYNLRQRVFIKNKVKQLHNEKQSPSNVLTGKGGQGGQGGCIGGISGANGSDEEKTNNKSPIEYRTIHVKGDNGIIKDFKFATKRENLESKSFVQDCKKLHPTFADYEFVDTNGNTLDHKWKFLSLEEGSTIHGLEPQPTARQHLAISRAKKENCLDAPILDGVKKPHFSRKETLLEGISVPIVIYESIMSSMKCGVYFFAWMVLMALGSYYRGDTISWMADMFELIIGILVKCIPVILNYFGKGGKMQTRFIGKSMYFDILMCGKWDERVDKTVPQLCVTLLRDNWFCLLVWPVIPGMWIAFALIFDLAGFKFAFAVWIDTIVGVGGYVIFIGLYYYRCKCSYIPDCISKYLAKQENEYIKHNVTEWLDLEKAST